MAFSRAIAIIGGWTAVSRLTGLLREVLIARFLGASATADAFFVAFRFPNLFRSLFAEGAFNAAFVPAFARKMEGEGKDAALDFAEKCYSVLFWILLVFVALMEMGMPWAMLVLAPGFEDVPGKMELAVELSRITFPYLLFISLVSLQSGVLNSMGRFAAAAGTPVLLNVVSVSFLVGLSPYVETPGHAISWGVAAAGLAQFLWLAHSTKKIGFALKIRRPRLTPEVVDMLKRVGPGALGAGAYQVNLAVNTVIASFVSNGAVSYLNYAERVNQLPLGVVGVAIGTALLPLLSRQLRSGDEKAAAESQNRAIELGFLLVLPSAAALMTIAAPVISVVFERGSFLAGDSLIVADVLRILIAGLPAYVLVKTLTPGFFARGDTATPMRLAVICMLVNVALNLALMKPFGVCGMAASTAVAAWLNVILLAAALRARGCLAIDGRLKSRTIRILSSSVAMAACLYGLMVVLSPYFKVEGLRIAALFVLVAGGVLAYSAAVLVFGAASIGEFKAMLARAPKA
ncbi:putative lipid II flippase MurJ [Alphaproteobacteria bacterium]|nr:putative lipid II flippase MurJ [Alphaproteobacteria bacterium]